MYILSYINIIVNIRTLLPFIMYKASYFFDFLINAPYFIKLKGSLSDTRRSFDLPIVKLLFVELIKLVYDKLRIYKDIPQGKLVVNFRNFT